MSEEQKKNKEEQSEAEPTRSTLSYTANIKLDSKKFVNRVGGFTLDEVKPQVAEFEPLKEGENLRVVEVNLLQAAIIQWQTVDTIGTVTDHTSLVYLDFVNDRAYNLDGSKVTGDLGIEIEKILLSAKGRYLTPNVPTEKLQQNLLQLLRSKQIFDHEGVKNV